MRGSQERTIARLCESCVFLKLILGKKDALRGRSTEWVECEKLLRSTLLGAAHELRTPVTSLSLSLDWVLRKVKTRGQRAPQTGMMHQTELRTHVAVETSHESGDDQELLDAVHRAIRDLNSLRNLLDEITLKSIESMDPSGWARLRGHAHGFDFLREDAASVD